MFGWIFPVVAILVFWIYRQATPGKMAISAKIVDATTGDKPSLQQYIVRYLGYILATIPFGLGIFWVAWDKRKQGWHDKLANTVVICKKDRKIPQKVRFSSKS
nr:RDD family protein [Vibrio lentus]